MTSTGRKTLRISEKIVCINCTSVIKSMQPRRSHTEIYKWSFKKKKSILVWYHRLSTWKKQDEKRAYWRLRNSMSYSCGVRSRTCWEIDKLYKLSLRVSGRINNSRQDCGCRITMSSLLKMGAPYGSTLAETFTIGTVVSSGLRAGLIQSERTPTRNGEKASPSAWLTRI